MSSNPEDTKKTILELIHDLKDNIFNTDDEHGDLMIVEFFFKRMHPDSVMDHVVKNILPHSSTIAERNIDFFLKNRSIFAGLPSDRVAYYAEIISEGSRLDDEDRQVIWEYFDTLVALAEDYKKIK